MWHRGLSKRTFVDKDDQSWVSVGPRPCTASLTAEMIIISARPKHIPHTPALVYIIPSRGTSSLFGNVPRKRVSIPLPEVNFFLRFRHVDTSQRSLILSHMLTQLILRTLFQVYGLILGFVLDYILLKKQSPVTFFVQHPHLMHTLHRGTRL